MKHVVIVLLTLGSTLVAGPAHAATSVGVSRPAAESVEWPGFPPSKPRCPERAPAGATFVRVVQPPFGLAYDLYASQGADGSTIYHQVHCPR
ncbi:hypothetical protein [Streptosporangium sp. NPDC000396]|uniref:hypothetical protein n=1 Tax=Streptosporangium sp. NPDC000396 TaxID=3366185 RepID=UPI00369235BE